MTYYKFLDENLQGCDQDGKGFVYDLPHWNGQTWEPSDWVTEPRGEKSDQACGVGLHLAKVLCPRWRQYVTCFEAEGKDLLGEDAEKARFKSVRLLRPVLKSEIFKPGADLSRADLSRAHGVKGNLPDELTKEAHC